MRVPDFVLNSVGFIAEVIRSEGHEDIVDLVATGFFVSHPSSEYPGTSYPAFVTAKHVAKDLDGKLIEFIVNKKGGGVMTLSSLDNKWYKHRDDSVDAVVTPLEITPDADIVSISTRDFVTSAGLVENKLGIGDEVFMPGLFVHAPGGEKRNMPILRHGNLAMLPDQPIQVESGFAEVYLIEARSIGGISGSPVFVRQTVNLDVIDQSGKDRTLHGVGGSMHLLGLVHGHWDIKESELNTVHFTHDSQRGVNLGIAVVVPAQKLLEIIVDHPGLIELRENHEAKLRAAISPKPDGV